MNTNAIDFSKAQNLLDNYGKGLPSSTQAKETLEEARKTTDAARVEADKINYHDWANYYGGKKIGRGLRADREAIANAEQALGDINAALASRFRITNP